MSMSMLRMSYEIRPKPCLELAILTSRVTKARKGSAKCFIIVTDSKTDQGKSIEST